MAVMFARSRIAFDSGFGLAVIALTALLAGTAACRRGEQALALHRGRHDRVRCVRIDVGQSDARHPNSRPRIDEVRSALAQVLPTATQHRRVGLITYGPGPYNQCNVKLDLKPTADAFKPIMRAVNALVPAGKTPLTSAVEQAAEVLNYRSKPGVIVVVTDGEETCGGSALRTGQAASPRCRPAHRSRHRLPL